MNGDIWWGIGLSFRLCRGVYLRVSGPALLAALLILVPVALCYLAIWLEIVLPINVVRHIVRSRRERRARV
jgi:hypothetical protein